MEKYGHLRPGTYDITSLRYDQMSEFGQMDFQMLEKKDDQKFELTKQKEKRIDLLLKKEGFTKITCQKLFKYIENATKAREFGKFIFTRNLSFILEILASFGEKHFLSRDELSHIPIKEFLAIFKHSDVENIEDRLRKISHKNKEKLAFSSAIRLPQVLYDFSGIGVIPFQVTQPNFITDKKLVAESINVSASINPKLLINKIVLIENADPGFDWIFSQKIAGLITKYGGANSHMAIRCAEFKIAAAIGCGEQRYEILLKAHKIMLDCSSSLIKVMK